MPPALKRFLTHPWVITSTIAACFVVFLFTMFMTYAPILVVEARYQYFRLLENTFHTTDIRQIILPSLSFDKIGIKYRDFGMEIPKLFLNEPVVFNVDPDNPAEYKVALQKGIAHAAGTDLPPYHGLGYYFAHSSSPELRNQYNAIFYLLGKLEKGDDVNLWYEDTKYEYVVVDKVVTNPEDTSFLQKQYALPTIVLQTCWPPGTTQKRLLIFAERKTATAAENF